MTRYLTCLTLIVAVAAPATARSELAIELQQLSKAVRSLRTPAEQESVVPQFVELGRRAFLMNDFAVAVTAFDYAQRIDRARHPVEAAEHKQEMARAQVARRLYKRLTPYLGKDDATSRRKLAEFQACVKGDWQTALPILAEGDDAIARAAALDMRHLGAEEAETVGDAWTVAARASSTYAGALYLRAGTLYDEVAALLPTPALLKKMRVFGSRIGYDLGPPAGAVAVKKRRRYAFTAGWPCTSGETVDKAFDGLFNTGARMNNGPGAWIGLDLGVPRTITRIAYAPYASSDLSARERDSTGQIGAVVQVSNRPDFKDAVTIYTVTEAPSQQRLAIATVTVAGVWRYVRYIVKAPNRTPIGEFDVY